MASEISSDIEKVARNLAEADRNNSEYGIEVAGGFKVPMWLTYVSAAKALLIQRDVLNKK